MKIIMYKKNTMKGLIAGVDEAGRGSLISRVYTATVIIDESFMEEADSENVIIRDSKKMTEKQRNKARQFIESRAIAYCVSWAEVEEIDTYNILQATMRSMHRALDGLPFLPDLIRVDGDRFLPYQKEGQDIPYECIVKGDLLEPSISCASILAKTFRDEFILDLVSKNPILEKYDVQKNMGYGTANHLKALTEFGTTPFHRKSFHIKKQQKRLLS